MTKGYALIDRESFQPFFSLLLFCGVALLLSVPFADRVKDFHAVGIFSGIPIYFHAQALFMGIFGLSLGAMNAAHGETGRKALLRMAEQIGLAQFLTLPYLLFTWALYPSKVVEILLIVLYTTIVSALCAVGSYLIETPWMHRSARGFLLKYAAFTGYRFAGILRRVEARSRRLCGLRLASVGLAGGGSLALILSLLRYTGLLRCTHLCILGLILLSLFGAGFLFIVGWMRRVDLPRTLLRIDLSLETGERLSSLYELHRRGGSNVFRTRLEEAVARQAFLWKRGLPLGRARFALLCGGMAVLASVLLVAFAPASLPSSVVAHPIVASENAEVRTIAPQSETSPTLPGGSVSQEGEAGLPGKSVPDRELEATVRERPLATSIARVASGG
jgi:hypothetical protein